MQTWTDEEIKCQPENLEKRELKGDSKREREIEGKWIKYCFSMCDIFPPQQFEVLFQDPQLSHLVNTKMIRTLKEICAKVKAYFGILFLFS